MLYSSFFQIQTYAASSQCWIYCFLPVSCILVFNIWVSHALEMTMNFYYPLLTQNFVYPTLFSSVPPPAINNDRAFPYFCKILTRKFASENDANSSRFGLRSLLIIELQVALQSQREIKNNLGHSIEHYVVLQVMLVDWSSIYPVRDKQFIWNGWFQHNSSLWPNFDQGKKNKIQHHSYRKSVLEWVKLQRVVGKCCKMKKI
jgi:hypothetical protein